jgi:glycosyltransferase involved in cell wall biosynthesis
MSRPRILVLTKTTALGGAERLLMNALPHLDRERFDYRLAAFDDSGPLARAWREAGLPVARMPAGYGSLPRALIALRRTLVQEGIDLVHAHLPVPGALARLATRGLPIRLVYTEHNTLDMYRPATRWLNVATYGWQNVAVAVSERVRESAIHHVGRRARGRSEVIANGIDPEQLDRAAAQAPDPAPPALEGEAFRVLVPATLELRKGQDLLVEAVAVLARAGLCSGAAPVHVWLAGHGGLRSALEAQTRRLGLAGRIHFLGQRTDVFALMRCADLVALPSRFEGHPLALLEAMALGKAVLASAVGGVPETVRAGETGLLVPRGDVRGLARALERLRADPELRMRLGAAAAREVRGRYHVRRTVAALENVYRGCLGLVTR